MIRIENLSFSYPPEHRPLLKNLNLAIPLLSWVVISGPDAVGKSTLAKLIKGLLKPLEGSIVLDGSMAAAQQAVAYIGGDPFDSFVGISVEEDIVFGLENLCLPRPEMQRRLRQALEWTGLCGMEQRMVHTLSGGEQQKLALASALAAGARILVLDEALNMLDRPVRCSIRSLVDTLRRDRGLTVIEVSNSFEDALSADRFIFLTGSTDFFDGPAAEFFSTTTGRTWLGSMGGVAALRAAVHDLQAPLKKDRGASRALEVVLCNHNMI